MKHVWKLLGGGGGWEVWSCDRCGEDRIPVPLLGLWRPWRRRCVETPGYRYD